MSRKEYNRFRWNGARWIGVGVRRGSFIGKCIHCRAEKIITFAGKQCHDCRATFWRVSKTMRSAASTEVARAKKQGRLPLLDGSIACVDCGRPARCYDHRDYSKPLDVHAVCISCNRKRGMAIQTATINRAAA